RWSQNILAQAQRVAQVNYEEAITIANLIPSQVGVYTEAQLQIDTWQQAIVERNYWRNLDQPILPVDHSSGGWQDESTFFNTSGEGQNGPDNPVNSDGSTSSDSDNSSDGDRVLDNRDTNINTNNES
ncbi:MAG: hypothetical protein F6K09_31300, partial [Merismopedia sp. SIO2A8]|nr:hypothetical protein [Merismopedia sp. SIO2A8]